MSSCQRCAAVPSSGSRAVPKRATWIATVASAISEKAIGRNALGRLIAVSTYDLTFHDLDLTTVNDECTHGALVLTFTDLDLTAGKAELTLGNPAGRQGRRGDCHW